MVSTPTNALSKFRAITFKKPTRCDCQIKRQILLSGDVVAALNLDVWFSSRIRNQSLQAIELTTFKVKIDILDKGFLIVFDS